MRTESASTLDRSLLSVITALIVALGPLYWLYTAVQHASYAGLGRDQGIFQGTAWAIAHGAVLYRDLREINGPVAHEFHLVARWLGGDDPHVLRTLDLSVSGFVFAFFGASLPGATSTVFERRSLLEQFGWGAAACSLLLGQYVAFYDAWHLTQRESFFDWFVLLGFAGVFRARGCTRAGSQRAWLLLAGIASATAWFGKPLCVVYSALHAFVFFWRTPTGTMTRRQQWRSLCSGLAAGCAAQLAFLVCAGDLQAFLRIYVSDNARYYVHVWQRSVGYILGESGHAVFFSAALALALGAAYLARFRKLGGHVLGLALFPVFGIVLEIVQGKAFRYHLHPVTAGVAALTLALLCHFARSEWRARTAPFVLLCASLLSFGMILALRASPHWQSGWAMLNGATPLARKSERYLSHYDSKNFSSFALHQAGDLLRRHTLPTDRIQLYGMDPYLLALAQRQSATPYIYSLDLNPDAVLEGIRAEGGSDAARAAARAIARRNVADLISRVQRDNPAAFIFFDRAPFMHPSNAFAEFIAHVPQLAPLLQRRYRQLSNIGLLRVYLRVDRLQELPTAQSEGSGIPPFSSR